MEPILASTSLRDLVSGAYAVADRAGAPDIVLAGLALLAIVLSAYRGRAALGRLIARVKVGPPPEPPSDGGAAADRDLPPAREGGGELGGGPTGGEG